MKKEDWDEEEDRELARLAEESGKKWSKIAKVLDYQRNEHGLKNRFMSLMKRMKKEGKGSGEKVEVKVEE